MFESLKPAAVDPILGLMAAFREDPRDNKIDLGVGVYQDDRGRTPVMEAVKRAESKLMELEQTKSYQGIAGDAEYNSRMLQLMFGEDHSILSSGRIKTLQAPGGSGALRVGAEVIKRARPEAKLWVGFIPFIDTAYQGLGDGLEEDAYGMRTMAAKLPEIVIASSCSKNFGLYRERTGSITFITQTAEQATVVAAQAMTVARQLYSMPPAHGALLVSLILGDEELSSDWKAELEEVRLRIKSMRTLLADSIQDNAQGMDFSHIKRQNGMFSFLGVKPEHLVRLREEFGIYIVSSTRINLAGINSSNINYLAESIKEVLK